MHGPVRFRCTPARSQTATEATAQARARPFLAPPPNGATTISLRWDQADLVHGRLRVNRLKNGIPSVHPLTGIELRALRRLQREQKPGRYVFMSERGAPMSAVAFRRMVTRLGPAAKLSFPIHPHMLRHSTGFKLANQGVDTRSLQHYLGHKNIQHTVRYSELSPERFRDFWKD